MTDVDEEAAGEGGGPPSFPIAVNIDDGIKRPITISQEIFGVVYQYGNRFEVMRFTLENENKDPVKVRVSSLGAALTNVYAPDRKGVSKDVILGFDDVEMYYCPLNPGFGRITSLCPLPYNLEKIVWDWDFDKEDGSVTFSTAFYKIDLVLSVKYKLTTENELIVDMKACGSKILPISLTNQVYWNLAGHEKGEASLQHHSLSLNSDRIWKHYNHKLKNFISVKGTKLDFRTPILMNNVQVFNDRNFEHVYVVSKATKQKMCFLARLIHPRSCRYVEIFSDQPWMLCNTLNKMPRQLPQKPNEFWGEQGEAPEADDAGTEVEKTDEQNATASRSTMKRKKSSAERNAELPFLEEIPGKSGAAYKKYGSFCITPISDLTDLDPLVRAGRHYAHTLIYKLGVYKKFCQKPRKSEEVNPSAPPVGLVDIKKE